MLGLQGDSRVPILTCSYLGIRECNQYVIAIQYSHDLLGASKYGGLQRGVEAEADS